jgi:hypothetical protein
MVLYAFMLPMVLARALNPASYSAYAIGLQVIPFLMLLASPVQAALAPKFARFRLQSHDAAREDDGAIAAAMQYCLALMLFSMVLAYLLSSVLPYFLNWEVTFAASASQAILYLGIASSTVIPAIVFTSYAAGNQNYLWENVLKCLGPYTGLVAIVALWFILGRAQDKLELAPIIVLSGLCTFFQAWGLFSRPGTIL